jgi:hypothetical protein
VLQRPGFKRVIFCANGPILEKQVFGVYYSGEAMCLEYHNRKKLKYGVVGYLMLI